MQQKESDLNSPLYVWDRNSFLMAAVQGNIVTVAGGTNIGVGSGGTLTFNYDGNIQFGLQKLVEYVASGALYDTAEITEPAKCHPGTREGVLETLYSLSTSDLLLNLMKWLHGPAGSGKSAIMRTFAERLDQEHLLLATFFFFRTSSTRNTADRFFATIAFQITRILPHFREAVQRRVELNPLIFTQSLKTQFHTLLFDPLQESLEAGQLPANFPRIILVDGLDECESAAQQKEILLLLDELVQQLPLRITVIISSRPHHDIQAVFELPSLSKITTFIALDDTFSPDVDIRKFYLDKFREVVDRHPFRSYLPLVDGCWPPKSVVDLLVEKASGQFVYASTVIKFIKPTYQNPGDRLDIIVGSMSAGKLKPFEELDLLYSTIFNVIDPDLIDDVLKVLGTLLLPGPNNRRHNWSSLTERCSVQQPFYVEQLFRWRRGECRHLLFHLHSLLSIVDDFQDIQFFHKSISDYLFDETRSGRFYIDLPNLYEFHARQWIRHRLYFPYEFALMDFGIASLEKCVTNAKPSQELHAEIQGLDLVSLSLEIQEIRSKLGDTLSVGEWIRVCNELLKGVRSSKFQDADQLYERLFHSFESVVTPRCSVYIIHPTLREVFWLASSAVAPPSVEDLHYGNLVLEYSVTFLLDPEFLHLDQNDGLDLLGFDKTTVQHHSGPLVDVLAKVIPFVDQSSYFSLHLPKLISAVTNPSQYTLDPFMGWYNRLEAGISRERFKSLLCGSLATLLSDATVSPELASVIEEFSSATPLEVDDENQARLSRVIGDYLLKFRKEASTAHVQVPPPDSSATQTTQLKTEGGSSATGDSKASSQLDSMVERSDASQKGIGKVFKGFFKSRKKKG